MTIVWKLSSASSRPCEISGWYGVYWVYHPGFWKTFRRMTGGTKVSEYPCPMKDRNTEFREASASSSSRRRDSSTAGGRSSVRFSRMLAGSVWSTSACSDGAATTRSISVTSVASGPMWRRGKESVSEGVRESGIVVMVTWVEGGRASASWRSVKAPV